MADIRYRRMRLLLFRIGTICLPLVALACVEVAWQMASPDRSLIPVPGHPDHITVNPEFGGRYFQNFLPQVAYNPFLKQKPDDLSRIVVLGGSSTAGFPYHFYHAFPERLATELRARSPLRRVEVINLGMTAIGSHVLRDMVPVIERLSPDTVLLYTGHNEYYGAFGAGNTPTSVGQMLWLKRFAIWMRRSKIYQALQDLVTTDPSSDRTMMARSIGNAAITVDGPAYRAGIRQFRANIGKLLGRLRSANIPTYVATVVSNLDGQAPLGDDSTAISAYATGQQQLADGDSAAAWVNFFRSKEHDAIRFRAPAAINAALRELAGTHGATLVDIAAQAWPDTLFTDHLHPTATGHEQIARAFADALAPADTIPPLHTTPDAMERTYARLQIARLKSGYPFVKGRTLEEELQAFNDLFRQHLQSGSLPDSLGAQVVVGQAHIPQALLRAVRHGKADGDTLSALEHMRALLHWQPFNKSLRMEAAALAAQMQARPGLVGHALAGEVLQLVSFYSPTVDYLNALAAIRIRQDLPNLARPVLAEIEQRDPGSSVMLFNTARLMVMTGDTLQAQSYFERYQQSLKTR